MTIRKRTALRGVMGGARGYHMKDHDDSGDHTDYLLDSRKFSRGAVNRGSVTQGINILKNLRKTLPTARTRTRTRSR